MLKPDDFRKFVKHMYNVMWFRFYDPFRKTPKRTPLLRSFILFAYRLLDQLGTTLPAVNIIYLVFT